MKKIVFITLAFFATIAFTSCEQDAIIVKTTSPYFTGETVPSYALRVFERTNNCQVLDCRKANGNEWMIKYKVNNYEYIGYYRIIISNDGKVEFIEK